MLPFLILLVPSFAADLHAQPMGAILREISADSIRNSVEMLAGFHTRHTMSDTVSDVRGIGAARRWIHREMSRYAAESGGRLHVSYHRYMQPPARRIAATAWAPASPADVRMDLGGLTNDTTIRWRANSEADLAGYRIVWRKTTSPHWEHHQNVGMVTTATIPLSKDNWIFGFQAVNTRGFVSPAVYPLP